MPSLPKAGKPVMPGSGRKWVASALQPGAKEPSSTQTGDNKLTRYTKRHPAFGSLGAKEQQS